MANITPVSSFDNVQLIDTTTNLLGGLVTAPLNVQAGALTNRTQFLYDRVAPTAVTVGASRNLTSADDGKLLEVTVTGVTLTMPNSGMPANFYCKVIATGNTSIASAGTALLNGSTTTVTRTAGTSPVFSIYTRASASNSYIVSLNS